MTDNRTKPSLCKTSLPIFLNWVFLSTCLNLGWEILHYPLYNVSASHLGGIAALAILHCTLGDALISAIAFLFTAILVRDTRWPHTHRRQGLFVFVGMAVAYTAFSEWKNTEVSGSWTYASQMPLFWKIGVSPLLQWVVVPVITLWLNSVKVWPSK